MLGRALRARARLAEVARRSGSAALPSRHNCTLQSLHRLCVRVFSRCMILDDAIFVCTDLVSAARLLQRIQIDLCCT